MTCGGVVLVLWCGVMRYLSLDPIPNWWMDCDGVVASHCITLPNTLATMYATWCVRMMVWYHGGHPTITLPNTNTTAYVDT